MKVIRSCHSKWLFVLWRVQWRRWWWVGRGDNTQQSMSFSLLPNRVGLQWKARALLLLLLWSSCQAQLLSWHLRSWVDWAAWPRGRCTECRHRGSGISYSVSTSPELRRRRWCNIRSCNLRRCDSAERCVWNRPQILHEVETHTAHMTRLWDWIQRLGWRSEVNCLI